MGDEIADITRRMATIRLQDDGETNEDVDMLALVPLLQASQLTIPSYLPVEEPDAIRYGYQNRYALSEQGTFLRMSPATQESWQTSKPSAAHPAMGGATPIRKRAKRKRSLAQTISFSYKFIRRDAIQIFTETWETTSTAWASLIAKTTLPAGVSISVCDLTPAVNALESAIVGKEGPMLLARFGYVQLSNWFDSLEDRIQQDRQKGLIPSKSGRGNASIAMDFYIHAQKVVSKTSFSRGQLQERKRIGGRWKELAGPSALLLVIYSDMAEIFVHVPSY